MKIKIVLLQLFILLLLFSPGYSVTPDEVLDDPALEERARNLSLNLRCLVCQNQSIDDSDAPLAKDLRVLLRERLSEGDSDKEVVDFLVSKYGEFILLKPRFNANTLILWVITPIILIIGLIAVFLFYRKRNVSPDSEHEVELTEAERSKLDGLISKD